jgi:hypothetical protein
MFLESSTWSYSTDIDNFLFIYYFYGIHRTIYDRNPASLELGRRESTWLPRSPGTDLRVSWLAVWHCGAPPILPLEPGPGQETSLDQTQGSAPLPIH